MPRKRLLWHLFPYYFLISIVSISAVVFASRVIWPPDEPASDLVSSTLSLLFFSLLIALLAAAATFAVIHRINKTMEETRQGARRFADGDLGFRLPVPASEEMGGLAETLNQMAAQLDDRIATISRQRNQLDAVLASMTEGVIALDEHQLVLQINQAASTLLGLAPEQLLGRGIAEVVRNIDLHHMVAQTMETEQAVSGEIVIYRDREVSLQIHCSPLRDATRETLGVLVVFSDITRLRRLERIRRDFVANVSHELKTPVTSIKGFAETLLDNPDTDPAETRRFLGIVNKQADRVMAIIEDLLSLSRIEQEGERGELAKESHPLHDVLHAAVQLCSTHADSKNIQIELTCDPDITLACNAPLLEQAVINLIDNAIKYSDPGKSIILEAKSGPQDILISVADQGFGIDPKHISRIFERFYRVDKARSRKVGGTGLGLSIVKHIVTAHGGTIMVESKVGAGSCFRIQLPQDV